LRSRMEVSRADILSTPSAHSMVDLPLVAPFVTAQDCNANPI
jgi:hypothetical protein